MTPIRIRPATAADAAEIVRLTAANAAFYGWLEELKATPETVRRDGFGEERLFWVFLAEADRAPVGMIQYFFVYNHWAATRGIRVTDLYVDEAARGRRVGRQLMATAAHQARRDGCSYVELRVQKDNRSAQLFYEELGMRVRVNDDCYGCRLESEALTTLAAEAC